MINPGVRRELFNYHNKFSGRLKFYTQSRFSIALKAAREDKGTASSHSFARRKMVFFAGKTTHKYNIELVIAGGLKGTIQVETSCLTLRQRSL